MIYPVMLYKVPGMHQCKGGTYNFQSAQDQSQYDQMIKDGWYDSIESAQAGKKPEEKKEESNPSLQEMAEGLGIKIDKRWSDKRLGEEIAKAMDGQNVDKANAD